MKPVRLLFPATLSLLLAAVVALVPPAPALAGWGGGSCGPVGPPSTFFAPTLPMIQPAPAAAEAGYRWVHFPDGDADQISLHRDGAQVGVYRYSTGKYLPLYVDRWGVPCDPPVPPPPPSRACKCDRCGGDCRCAKQDDCDKDSDKGREEGGNFGVDLDRLRGGRYYHNGVEVTKAEAYQAVADSSKIPDDADFLRLTVSSADPASRKKVVDDLASAPELAAWKGRLCVQSYGPEDWPVKHDQVKITGPVTISVQTPGGEELHRQDDYEGGAAGLAKALASLRDPDPDYSPAKSPDLRKPRPVLPENLPWPLLAGLAVAGGSFLVLSRGKKPKAP